MARILITGVAGFIASNLAKYLVEDEKNIIIGIDDFSCSSMSNLYPLFKKSNFIFEEHNLINPINQTVDCIYHLCGNEDKTLYFENKYDFMLNQIEIIKNIVKLSRLNGARLILPTQYYTYCDYNLKLHKYFDLLRTIESLICELIDENNINAVFARLDYVYGKNFLKTDKRFIPETIDYAINNKDITLEYDESFYFTYVDDVVYNLKKLMNNYSSEAFIDIFSSNLYLKSDIIKLIINYTKSNSKLIIKSPNQYNPSYSLKNNALDNGLELNCKTPVIEGILNTIKNFKLLYYN